MRKAEVLEQARKFAEEIKSDSHTWEVDPDSDGLCECRFVGTYMMIQPSGKYYMPWTSNQTVADIQADMWFWEEVERLLPEYSFASGEGDPCDVICYRPKQ